MEKTEVRECIAKRKEKRREVAEKKTNCLKKEKTRARKRKQRELFEMFRRIK